MGRCLSEFVLDAAKKVRFRCTCNEHRTLSGWSVEYHANGREKRRVHWLDGQKNGKELAWDEAGLCIKDVDWVCDIRADLDKYDK